MGLKKTEGPQLLKTGELEQFPSQQLWLQAFGCGSLMECASPCFSLCYINI